MENKQQPTGTPDMESAVGATARSGAQSAVGATARSGAKSAVGASILNMESAVGARVRELRQARGLSQTQLGQALGALGYAMEQPTVYKLENGLRPLRLNELAALADALDTDIYELLDFTSTPEMRETLNDVIRADRVRDFARMRVREAEEALAREREKLHSAEAEVERARRRFHEVRGIDPDEED